MQVYLNGLKIYMIILHQCYNPGHEDPEKQLFVLVTNKVDA